ncbi:MAG: hypothetical protein MJD61_02330 [Proteobacteria bacterium]|nr:hypothetical protein [Pseudomonadota bacterium]
MRARRLGSNPWLVAAFCVALNACVDGSTAAPTARYGQGAGGCVDRDGDGFGRGCLKGTDCNDNDPQVQRGCGRCVRPSEGCACAEGQAPIECSLPETRNVQGLTVCHRGSRYCRDGHWTGCESVHDYLPSDSEAASRTDPDAGGAPCSACDLKCRKVSDPIDSLMDAGVTDNIAFRDGGSIVLAAPDAGGASVCPSYQKDCGSGCVTVSTDPNNCGDCGVVCTGTQTCSAGRCQATCLPGLHPCNNTCVNLHADNDNCGFCGNTCAAGRGCVWSTCRTTAVTYTEPAMCAGGGPPLDISDGSTPICAIDLANEIFDHALCSCDGFDQQASLLVDAYNSALGPYAPGELGGNIGVNTGAISISAETTVWGDLLYDPSATQSVGAPLTVYGTSAAQSLPCRACPPNEPIDIAAVVDAHELDNDNALIGLDPALWSMGAPISAPAHLRLPCGHYYLDSIHNQVPRVLAVHGRTALYLGGAFDSSSFFMIYLAPDAELDLFIKGALSSSSALHIGSPNHPGNFRLYVHDASAISLDPGFKLAGNLYAPNASASFSMSPVEVHGAVFAQSYQSSSTMSVHYDKLVDTRTSCAALPILRPGSYWQDLPPHGCGTNERPDWQDLTFSASMPSDTSIRFEACTADTEAGLDGCSYEAVGSVYAAHSCSTDLDCVNRPVKGSARTGQCGPNGVCQFVNGAKCTTGADCATDAACAAGTCWHTGQPLDLGVGIGADSNYLPFCRVRFTLMPNRTHDQTPVLSSWDITYSCRNVE